MPAGLAGLALLKVVRQPGIRAAPRATRLAQQVRRVAAPLASAAAVSIQAVAAMLVWVKAVVGVVWVKAGTMALAGAATCDAALRVRA